MAKEYPVVNMTFEQFQETLETKFGKGKVSFREQGKHGWSTPEDILNKQPGGRPGPHWCDAAPIPSTQWLLGTYNFNTSEAKFFS